MRPSDGKGDEGGDQPGGRGRIFNLTPTEGTNFDLSHRHSGIHGDGQPIQATSLDTTNPFSPGLEPTYTPINSADSPSAQTSGRKYRIQIYEVLDENGVLQPNIQIIPVA